MNTKYFLILFCLTAFLIGCGDDTVTNNNNGNNTETLIFSKDSINLEGTGIQSRIYNEIVVNDVTVNRIKVKFTCATDCLPADLPSAGVSVYADTTYYITGSLNNLNNSYEYTVTINPAVTSLDVALYFETSSTRFLRITDIKIYKIS